MWLKLSDGYGGKVLINTAQVTNIWMYSTMNQVRVYCAGQEQAQFTRRFDTLAEATEYLRTIEALLGASEGLEEIPEPESVQ